MKIREGAYYRTRGGDDKPGAVVGPMQYSSTSKCWYVRGWSWTASGARHYGVEDDMDLISEVYVSDTPPSDEPAALPAVKETEAQLRDMMRDPRYWRTREPEFVKRVTEGFRALVGGDTPPADAPLPDIITDQPCKTLRDEFAMEAMKLLQPKHDWAEGMLAFYSYKQADAMMEARKK
jgi:hypothetical protein